MRNLSVFLSNFLQHSNQNICRVDTQVTSWSGKNKGQTNMESDTKYYFYVLVGAVIRGTGILGNGFIILYFRFRSRRRSSYSLFITLLAAADGTTCVFGLLFVWVQITMDRWPYGPFVCKYIYPLENATNITACWIVAGMAYERYRGIVYPMCKNFNKRLVYVYCGTCLFISVLAILPLFIAFEETNQRECGSHKLYQLLTPNGLIAYLVAVFVVQITLPLLCMVYFYLKIKRCLLGKQRFVQTLDQIDRKQLQRSRAVLRVLLMIIVVFSLSLIPYDLFNVIHYITYFHYPNSSFYKSLSSGDVKILYTVISQMFYLNSVINCFVYAGCNKEFRDFLKSCCYFRTRCGSKYKSRHIITSHIVESAL